MTEPRTPPTGRSDLAAPQSLPRHSLCEAFRSLSKTTAEPPRNLRIQTRQLDADWWLLVPNAAREPYSSRMLSNLRVASGTGWTREQPAAKYMKVRLKSSSDLLRSLAFRARRWRMTVILVVQPTDRSGLLRRKNDDSVRRCIIYVAGHAMRIHDDFGGNCLDAVRVQFT